jgi:hypothetical protein
LICNDTFVIPAQAGIQFQALSLDSRLRGNDEKLVEASFSLLNASHAMEPENG